MTTRIYTDVEIESHALLLQRNGYTDTPSMLRSLLAERKARAAMDSRGDGVVVTYIYVDQNGEKWLADGPGAGGHIFNPVYFHPSRHADAGKEVDEAEVPVDVAAVHGVIKRLKSMAQWGGTSNGNDLANMCISASQLADKLSRAIGGV